MPKKKSEEDAHLRASSLVVKGKLEKQGAITGI